jgi:hypothetical protein
VWRESYGGGAHQMLTKNNSHLPDRKPRKG